MYKPIVFMLTGREKHALSFIRNHIRHLGKMPSMRLIKDELGYKSPRSAQLIVQKLVDEDYLVRKFDGEILLGKEELVGQTTVNVPIVGTVACGQPIFAEENIEGYVPVSTQIASSKTTRYFILRAKGDSMNKKGIHDGDLILVREQNTARNGDIVVALIDDEATIKELQVFEDYAALIPHSTDSSYKPIILHEDFFVQ